ncbi:MAG: hypothetical protein NTZ05_19455 [Chloroflexi bacterium]|nr:hypothetical protein [Chloroflexota bacterium]
MPYWSVTSVTSGFASRVVAAAIWLSPLSLAMAAGTSAAPVTVKATGDPVSAPEAGEGLFPPAVTL